LATTVRNERSTLLRLRGAFGRGEDQAVILPCPARELALAAGRTSVLSHLVKHNMVRLTAPVKTRLK